MNMFTLLYKVGIQFFYKVVHIIQEHVLVYYYYNHLNDASKKSKMLQRYTKAILIN
jgi:hypothetical protein